MILPFLVGRAILLHPVKSGIAAYWWIAGKRERARNRFNVLLDDRQRRYDHWLAREARKAREHLDADRQAAANLAAVRRVLMLCRVADAGAAADVAATLTALKDQLFSNWTLWLVADLGGLDAVTVNPGEDERVRVMSPAEVADQLAAESADYVGWLRAGDRLPENALFEMVKAMAGSGARLAYSDEDQINQRGRRSFAHFKPAWNFELLLACDYVGGLALLTADCLKGDALCADPASWHGRYHALVHAGANMQDDQVVHVPQILYQRYAPRFIRAAAVLPQRSGIDHGAVLTSFSRAQGSDAVLVADRFGTLRLKRMAEGLPLVSLIVPTRDTLRLTRKCVRSILDKTDYENFELLIVDNDSQQAATHAYFDRIGRHPKVRIVKYPGVFNYSAINNFAAGKARGDYIGLINNDTEVITPTWLSELMAYATQADIGAVGAKLLYGDGRIQHAGVFTGMGQLAGHGHRFLKNNAPGYFYRAHLNQYVSAVTGACLVVAKHKFEQVGGLDDQQLQVAFNDVDLCLKLQAAGFHNVYVPHAVLYHYESKSRGKDLKGKKRERYLREVAVMQERWRTDKEVDRYFHKSLSPAREDFVLPMQYER